METKFKYFGTQLSFPLDINADWVRIQCGVDGNPNYIFGLDAIVEFYQVGTGIYTRENGKPKQSLDYWKDWYVKQRDERIRSYSLIQDIKQLVNSLTDKQRKALDGAE